MGRKSKTFKVIAILMGCLLSALAGELILRVFFSASDDLGRSFRGFDPLGVEIEPFGDRGYRPIPGASFEYYNGTVSNINAIQARGEMPPTGEDFVKIVLIGGSTAHGWGVNDEESIDAHLKTILKERGVQAHVYNFAFDGYDSWQCYQRLKVDALPLNPDVIIVHSGINDVRNAKIKDLTQGDPRSILWATVLERLKADQERGGPTLWTRMKHYSYLARFPGFLKHLRQESQALPEPSKEPFPVYPEAAEVFEQNLQAIHETFDSQTWFLGSTPPSRLRLDPSEPQQGVSYWLNSAAQTQAYRERLATVLRAWSEADQTMGYLSASVAEGDFLDDCHLKSSGNKKVAQQMADWLVPRLAVQEEAP